MNLGEEVALAPGLFSGLNALERLYLEYADGPNLAPLPAGIFEGLTSLKQLTLPDDVPLSFRFERVDGLADQRFAQLRLISVQGAPSTLVVSLSASNADLAASDNSAFGAMIPTGFVASMPFKVTRLSVFQDAAVRIIVGSRERPIVNVPDPDDPSDLIAFSSLSHGCDDVLLSASCGSGRYSVTFDTTPLVFTLAGDPSAPSAVSITSRPDDGNAYGAGEVIRVEVTFNSEITVGLAAGEPTLRLDVGGQERTASFVTASSLSMSFTYTVTNEDYDSNGISIADDALVRGRAQIISAVSAGGSPANLALPAIEDESDHKVAGRRLSLSLSLESASVTAGSFSTATLTLLGDTSSLDGEALVQVSLTPDQGLDAPSTVTLRVGDASAEFRLSADLGATLGDSSLMAHVEQDVQDSLRALVSSTTLGVRVIIRVVFEPAEIRLVRGGAAEESASTMVVLKTERELQGSEELGVGLSATNGLEVSPDSVMLNQARSTASVTVTASSGAGSGEVSATSDSGTSEPLMVEVVRGVELSLSDHAGQAVEMVMTTAGESIEFTVATEPSLERDERVTVTLSVDSRLSLSSVDGPALIDGNVLVLTSAENSTSARISVSTSSPGLNLAMGISASGEGENVGVVGESPSLGVVTAFSGRVAVVLSPQQVEVQQGSTRLLSVTTFPELGEMQSVMVRLTIAPADAGLSFAGNSSFVEVSLGETRRSVDVEVFASAEAEIGSIARVTSMEVDASVGLSVVIDNRSEATLEVLTPQVTLGFTPADVLELNLSESKAVELSLTDFTLSGNQAAVFEVSVSGGGLTLQGGTPSLEVSLSTVNVTAEVTVMASDSAFSVGELSVRALSGVELAGDAEAATLPIEVLQEHQGAVRIVPNLVEIQRGRSTEFEVVINPPLVADRKTTVTLTISEEDDFSFGDAGLKQHEIAFGMDNSRETVRVATTAPADVEAVVSVNVIRSSGIQAGGLPSLRLRSTLPLVEVVFSPADELRLPSGGEAPVTLSLDNYPLAGDQEIVLNVSADDGGLTVSPPNATLTATSPTATVQVSASRRVESGNLMVSALSGAELVGDTQLPVLVSPRQLAVSFDPSMVRVVRGGAAAETASAEVSLSVAPVLEGDEELVLGLTSGAGNLGVSPDEATLSSEVRAVDVTVTASAAGSGEVAAFEGSGTSIGNAEVSFTPLTVEVVRGVELSLSDHEGQAVELLAIAEGRSTEITVATSPTLVGDERVTVTLNVLADFAVLSVEGIGSELIGGDMLVLTSAMNSSTRVRVNALLAGFGRTNPTPGISVSGVGENVGVVGDPPSLRMRTEFLDEAVVVLSPRLVEVQQGRSAMFLVTTNPPLGAEQAVTVRLMIAPADRGLSFAESSSVTDVRLGGTQPSADVAAFASAEAVVGNSVRVTSVALDATSGLGVDTDGRSEATLEVTTPRVTLGLRPAGGEIGDPLSLGLGESKAVELSLTDFTLSGNQTAEFEVSVSGDGLSLQGGTVSLDADNATAGVTVMASTGAVSVGELSARVVSDSGVELAGGAQAATWPVEVLQPVSLSFDPDLVLIQRGRSTEFEVRTSEPLVADRMVTVTLRISEEGFSFFDAGSVQHEITFDAGKSRETVTAAATAPINLMALVSVNVTPSSGVQALVPPSLNLQATLPLVEVAFSPAAELRLPSGGEASVTLSLADYSLTGDQAIVLDVSTEGEGLAVSPASVTLTEDSPMAAVRVTASRSAAESGNLMVSAVSGAELVGRTQLPVVVSARQLAVSFEPSMVKLVRGGAAAEMVSTVVSLSVAPALEGDEELVLELTSGAGNLGVNPDEATLSSEVRAVDVTVSAGPATVSAEVVALEGTGTSIGNAVVSFMPLTVEVVRGVELLLSDHAGQAVEMITITAGEATEIKVATEPPLEEDERVTVTLSVAEGLSVAGSELIGGNTLVLTSAENSSARVSVSTSTPDLDLAMGISASGVGENVGVVGESTSLRVITEVSGEVAVVLSPQPVEVQQGSRTMLRVETFPQLAAGQSVMVRLTIAPADAGLSFAGGSLFTDVSLGETQRSVDVEVFASAEAVIGSSARVTSMVVDASVGLSVVTDARSEATLEVTLPQVTLGFTPADVLELNLSESRAVELSLTGFTLSGNQVAEFEVSVEGEGLTLEGGVQMIRVSFAAGENTKSISVMASADAASVGRLVVRPVGGVELAGDMGTATLPIEVLQSVSLSFEPDLVEIQRGRSTEFEVVISPPLIADRMVTVALRISEEGFSFFDAGSTQHEVVLDAGKSSETVTVAATAAEGLAVQVSVVTDATPGVDLAPPPSLPPSLSLQATLPMVEVAFSPDDVLQLPSGGEASVTLSLADYSLAGDQAIVLGVSADDGGLTVSPTSVTLTEDSPTAAVRVTASRRVESGNLVVSALSGVELVGETQLSVSVSPRQLAVSFEPSMVRLVRGGAAAEMASAEVRVSVAPALEGDEELVLELTSGVAGNLSVSPDEATLSSEVRAVDVTVTASAAGSGEVMAAEGSDSSIGHAGVSFMPLTVDVVRGVALSLSEEMVTIVAGESAEITVTTEPALEGDERVTVTLSVAEGLSVAGSELIGENTLVLTSAANSTNARVRVNALTPGLDLAMGISASGVGENVGVVGEAPSLDVATEFSRSVTVVLSPQQVEVQQGSSTMFRVETDPQLEMDEATTLRLTIVPADAGLSFAGGSPSMDVSLVGETQQSVDVEVFASAEVEIGSSARVTSMRVDASFGLDVITDARSEATLEVTTPEVTLGFMPADVLELNLGESKAVGLSLTDFTLSGNQRAVFEVSVSGDGLSLEGGTPNLEVSLDAVNTTAEVTVMASDGAGSAGELSVRAVSGVEAETMTLPISVLQSVSLVFDPDVVEIQRGRSTEFEVRTNEPLVADRMVTVTLAISEEGFSFFDAGSMQHEIVFDAGKSSETVTVSTTAAEGLTAQVSVDVMVTSGVDLTPPPSLPPSLNLQATLPMVEVVFSPATELQLPSGGEASVTLSLADYSLAGDQMIVLGVSADDDGLEVAPLNVTLTATSPTATVQVSASRRVESGNLMVSAVSGAELVGDTQLPVSVSARQLAVSFEPSMVRLVRGGAAAETVSTEVSLNVAPALEGEEELVLELTSGVAGNLGVSPDEATLSSEVTAVEVTVTASAAGSGEVMAAEGSDSSIGHAEVSFMPLTVEVVRGVELSLSDHTGQAVEMITITAGESAEITVATEPALEGDERVTVTLSVAEGLSVAGSGLIGGNTLVLTSAENSTSAQVSVSTSAPGLNLAMGISASGVGENVGVVGESTSLRVVTEVAGEVAVVLSPQQVEVQQGHSAMFRVETDPQLAAGQSVMVQLTIAPADAGLSFAGGSPSMDVNLGETEQSVDVEVFASAEAEIGGSARVSSMEVDASVGLSVVIDGRSEATLEVTAPQVTLGLRPEGDEIGDTLSLGLGESRAVELSLTGFTLSGNQVAEFAVSVEGEGLTLEGGAQMIQVSFAVGEDTKPISVMASDDAASVGRLVVRPVSGVELAGDMETATLPIEVLQSVSLSFEPATVEIQRGRSAQFKVVITPLVADRRTTVTLVISEEGFSFDAGSTQYEVVLDAGKSSETVRVAAMAAEGLTAQVSVMADGTPGVDLAPLPSLSLQATLPMVEVSFSPADELRLPSGGEASVTLSLADYSLAGDQEIVLNVSVDGEGLEVNRSRVTLTGVMQLATVQVSASRSAAESGNLMVSAASGAELVGRTQLPVSVSPRQLAVSFEPSMVRLVRGGAAASTDSAEVSLSVAPVLGGEEELVLELTSGAGNLGVSPDRATLSSEVTAVDVTVTADPETVSGEVMAAEGSGTSIGNAEVSFMPLTVEVVRGVELSLSDHAGQAVEMITITAGDSTEITVATSPTLVGDERVTVTLSVAEGLSVAGSELIGGNTLVLTSAENSSARVSVSTSTPDLDLAMGISASGVGENVAVVGEVPSLDVATEVAREVAVVFSPQQVEVQQGSRTMFRVGTFPQLAAGQSVTVQLTIAPADAGLSFADGSLFTDVSLGETQQSVDVEVFASAEAVIESSARVTSMEVDASEGLGVVIDDRSEATLEVTLPQVTLGLRPEGDEIGDTLSLGLGESRVVELSLTDFTLSGNQTAVFEVSVSGGGLTLQDDTPNLEVSLDAVSVTAGVTVMASTGAISIGELSVMAVSGVELAGDAEATTLPIEVLQSVELVFDPDVVEIQRGRSTEFEVRTSEPLVADRMVTVTLMISGEGFSFDAGSTQYEVVLDADGSREAVTVSTTAAEGLTAQVSVMADGTPGVDLAPPPSLSLQATLPMVEVAFSPAGELRLPSGGDASVTLSLADYSLAGDQMIVLDVSVDGEGLEVSLMSVTLTAASPSATVQVSASRSAVGPGSLTVSAARGAELVGETQSLPVVVEPRQLAVSFDPSMVRLVRGGVVAEMASTEVWLSVAPALEGNEELVLKLTSGDDDLGVDPDEATLSSEMRAVQVRVVASLTTVSTEVTVSMVNADTSIGNAEVSFMPLTVEVVRGVDLSLSEEMVTITAGESTEITVATEPLLERDERVTVTLMAEGDGLTLPNTVELSSARTSATVLLTANDPGSGRVIATGMGQNVEVVSGDSVGITTERAKEVSVTFDPAPEVEIERGRSALLTVGTSVGLDDGQSVTVSLGVSEDSGFSFGEVASSSVEIVLIRGMSATSVRVRSSTAIGVRTTVDVKTTFEGVSVAPPERLELVSVPPEVSVMFDPAGKLSVPSGGEASVALSLDDYPLVEDQEIVLNVSVDGEGLTVSPTSVTLTETVQSAMVQVSASRRVESGNLMVTASGATLVGETQLPVVVTPRQLAVSFDPSMVRLVRGGAADDTASADVSVSVAPALEGDEELVLELTSGVAGNLGVNPLEATLSSETRAVTVTVTAGSGMVSTEVVALEGSGTSIGNAEVSFTPLTVKVVRGVELLISGVGGADAVSFSAGASTELLVTTSPTLTAGESVAVNLEAKGDGLTLRPDTVELSGAQPSSTVSLEATDPDVSGQVAATGTGQNVGVVRGDSVGITTEAAVEVSVTFDPAREVEIERGRSALLTVGTSAGLTAGQSVTVTLSVSEDSGFSFGELASSSVEIVLVGGMSATVLVRSSTAIGVRAAVDVRTTAEGVLVAPPESLRLASVTPMVSVAFSVAGEVVEALVLPANSTSADVSLSLGDYELAVGQEAVLAVSVQGAGLTVDTQEVTLSGTTPSATVAVTATLENASGTLTAAAVSGVELRVPAELPVSVELKPAGLRLRIRVFLEGALE